jgi:hypothetical protein
MTLWRLTRRTIRKRSDIRKGATMQIETMMDRLEILRPGVFPRHALRAAVAQQEEVTPYLLRSLEDPQRALHRLAEQASYMLPFYAFFLLAQFREERAYPLIVNLFAQPGDRVLDLTGDFVTEDLGRVLASVSGGGLGPMQTLVENPRVNEYVRSAAMGGLVTLVVEEVIPREEVIAYFRTLFRGGLEKTYTYAWDSLVSECSHLYPQELMPEIRQAFADDLINERAIDLPWIEKVLDEGKSETLARLRDNSHYRFVTDTIREMEGWYTFQAPPPPLLEPVTQPAAQSKKVGRNDPCPCGSGIKYKYCCGKRY